MICPDPLGRGQLTRERGLCQPRRGALGDELGVNPALPKDLDAQVFGYFDELDGMRAAALAAARPKKAAPPTPAATSAATPAADPAADPTPSTGT